MVLIAPRSDLDFVDKEVEALLRLNCRIFPILGDITVETLTKEIGQIEKADVLWIATHLSAGGQLILGDTSIPFERFVALIRGRFKLVYLNTCASQSFAQSIQSETGVAVVATIKDVQDEEAYQIGSLFAATLVKTRSPQTAYKMSLPANNSTYIFLGGLNSDLMFDNETQTEKLQELTKAFYKLDATLNAELIIMKQRLQLLEENNRHISKLIEVLQEQNNKKFFVIAILIICVIFEALLIYKF